MSYHLDKDLLVKGNKVYSPEACCFIPEEINSSITTRSSSNNVSKVVGVFKHKTTKRYRVFSNTIGQKRKHVGYYKTSEEAFEVYKRIRELHNKALAEKWKGKIDDKVYMTLLTRKIELSD